MKHEVSDFDSQVLERSRAVPVVVDFWAPWCAPCLMLGPIIEKLAEEAGERWDLVKINTQERPDLADRYRIRSIPIVKLFRDGEVVDEFLGVLPEAAIRDWLKPHIPSPHAETVSRANEQLSDGKFEEAIALLEPVIEAEPDNDEARFLLAKACVSVVPSRVGALVHSIPGRSEFWYRAEALKKLAGLSAEADHPDDLPQDAASECYLEGVRCVKAGDYDGAIRAFIDVIRKNRTYNEGSAKDACKAIFQSLGAHHPITTKYYQEVASVLYA